MKLRLKVFLILILILNSFEGFSKIKVEDLNFIEKGFRGELKINFKGKIVEKPLLFLKKNILQVTLPSSVAWPKIEKKVSVGNRKYNTTLLAYQYNKNDVRVRILFSENHNLNINQIEIKKRKNELSIIFPTKKFHRRTTVLKREKSSSLQYDESYLEGLLKDNKNGNQKKRKNEQITEDEIKVALSSNLKNGGKNTFNNYLLKFVFFIFLIIGFLYGSFYLFKKGILKKGKLGFLKNSEGVNIVSTTYLGPKKNLLVVKVYDQILLLGSSESGVNLITELKNTTSVVKDGEASISGTNFDINLEKAEKKGKEFKIKEDLINNKDLKKDGKERFSQQIKNKLKDLKRLQ